MRFASWSERSLRSWVAIGMALTVLPLAVSSVVGYLFLDRGVISAFQDVAARNRDQIQPAQQLRLALWEASVPVNEYLDAHEATEVGTYRALRVRIEGRFAQLRGELRLDPRLVDLLARAQEDWSTADRIASDMISVPRPPGDARSIEMADRFDGLMASSADKLRAVCDNLAMDVQRSHDAALLADERSEWVASIAAGVSLVLMILGVSVIGRIMVVNIERLVDGARKFADGDRNHRIDVQVPPELRRVADEFNRMIGRIHDSEAALAEEAREDAMTGLANRRAFEESLNDAFARKRRLGESVLLLMLDVDHFKKVNDAHGHAAGDEVLRSVGRTLKACIREVDKAFRIGGEEFAVLVVGTDVAGAQVAAERLRAAIAARPIPTERAEVRVTTSIGIALAHAGMQSAELLAAADAALYRAKAAGRNRVALAPSAADAQASNERT